MYAHLWEEDQAAKCRREEIEAAMQIERNEEMLKVLTLQTAAIEKQKEEMRDLKEKEAQLLVKYSEVGKYYERMLYILTERAKCIASYGRAKSTRGEKTQTSRD